MGAVSSFQNQHINLPGAHANFSKIYSDFEKNPNAENMQKVQDANKVLNEQTASSAQIINDMMKAISEMSSITNMTTKQYDKLPDNVKKALDFFKKIEETTGKSAKNLAGFGGDFPMGSSDITGNLLGGLKDSNSEFNKMTDMFSKLKRDASGVFAPMKDMAGKILGTIGSIGSTMNSLGLGVGIPTSIGEAKGYIKNSVEWYKKFGQMDVSEALAQNAQGGGVNNNILMQNRQLGMDMSLKTFDIIKYDDYANMSNSLMNSVQGHYGQGNNKGAGQIDMQSMTRTAVDLSKLYGVDSQGTISTFYKELNMEAGKTEELMRNLAGTAQAANIPVSEYTKTVTNLSLQFRDAGIGIESVQNGMRNLVMSGMTLNNAQNIMNDVSSAGNKFAQSTGNAMYFGMQSGAGSNEFEAYNALNLRWDKNGYVKDGADQKLFNAMDAALSTYTGAYGDKNSDVGKFGIQQVLKNQFGITNAKDVSQLTELYASGDIKGFGDLMSKKSDGKPPGQDELEAKLEKAASYTDELTKAEKMNTNIQQQLATVNKSLLDMIGKGLQKLISALGSAIVGLSRTITGLISGLGGIASLFTTGIAGFLGLKGATKFGGLGGSSGLSKAKGVFSATEGFSGSLAGRAGGMGAAASTSAKALGRAPIVGGLIDGGVTYFSDKAQGMTTEYAAGEAIGSGVGTIGGGWAGAAGGAALGQLLIPIPGVGAVIGGIVGGIGGGFAGSHYAKKATSAGMDYFGVKKFENGTTAAQNDSTINNDFYSNVNSSSSPMMSGKDFNDLYKIDESAFSDPINASDTAIKQTQTNIKLDQVKDTQSTLMGKSNQLSVESYNLNNSKYSEMISQAKDQFSQLTNIAKLIDSGFTFLDKMLNNMYNKMISKLSEFAKNPRLKPFWKGMNNQISALNMLFLSFQLQLYL
jgi:hypothetical protein